MHVWLFEHVMLYWCDVLCEHVYIVFGFLFRVVLTDLLSHMSCHLFIVLIYLLLTLPTSGCYMRVFSLTNYPHKSHSIPEVNPSRVLVKFLRATHGFQLDTHPLWGF